MESVVSTSGLSGQGCVSSGRLRTTRIVEARCSGSSQTLGSGETSRRFLPTPTAGDSRASRNRTAGRRDPNSKHHDGVTLSDWIRMNPSATPTSKASEPQSSDEDKQLINPAWALQSTSSAVASPASPSPSPAARSSTPTTAGSGPKCVEFARWSDRDGCWLKTSEGFCQLMLDGSSEEWCETWPRSGTLSNGIAYQRQPLAPLTSAIGSSLSAEETVPTPSAAGFGARDIERLKERRKECKAKQVNGNGFGLTLNQWVVMWPTPNSADSHRGEDDRNRPGSGGPNLLHAARHWPTPTSRDWKDGRRSTAMLVPESCLLGRAVHYRSTVSSEEAAGKMSGSLNPTWVEWLMGFPLGWTDSKRLETLSYRKLLSSSGD